MFGSDWIEPNHIYAMRLDSVLWFLLEYTSRLKLVDDERRTLLKITSDKKMRSSNLILKKPDRRSLDLTLKESPMKISNLRRSLDLMLKKLGTSLTKLKSAAEVMWSGLWLPTCVEWRVAQIYWLSLEIIVEPWMFGTGGS